MATSIPASGSGLSTADAAYIHTWYNTQQAWLTSKLPSLTEFRGAQLGTMPDGLGGGALDGLIEGGGTASPSAAWMPFSTLVWQAPKTSGFGMVVRGKFNAVSVSYQSFGVADVAKSNYLLVSLTTSIDATKLFLALNGAGSTNAPIMTVADTAVHDYAMLFDQTTITVYQDQTLIGSQATLTNFANAAMAPGIFNTGTAAQGFNGRNAIWGYVAP